MHWGEVRCTEENSRAPRKAVLRINVDVRISIKHWFTRPRRQLGVPQYPTAHTKATGHTSPVVKEIREGGGGGVAVRRATKKDEECGLRRQNKTEVPLRIIPRGNLCSTPRLRHDSRSQHLSREYHKTQSCRQRAKINGLKPSELKPMRASNHLHLTKTFVVTFEDIHTLSENSNERLLDRIQCKEYDANP